MFRMGRDQHKEQPATATQSDETADHTPPASPAYGTQQTSSATSSSSQHQSASTPPLAASSTTSRAVTESESLARDIKEGTLSGFVGNGTVLTGEATFRGMLRVDGHLSGRVSSPEGTLIVSTNGQVDADVEVAVAQIYGTITGDVVATKRIEMGRVAKVTGNIQTPALVIEHGAIFEGSCRMVQPKEAQETQNAQTERAMGASVLASTTTTGVASSSSNASASPSTVADDDDEDEDA